MMKKQITVFCLSMIGMVIATASVIALNKSNSIDTGETQVSPQIDGRLNDACWKDIPSINDFKILGTVNKPESDTKVMVTSDKLMLYLAFECREKDNYRSVAKTEGHSRDAVNDDSVEIFLMPNPESKKYYHFIVGANGSWFEKKVNDQSQDKEWQVPWLHAVKKMKNGWNAEVGIPLYLLGGEKIHNPEIGFNVTRNLFGNGKKQYLTWAPLGKSFHETENFGVLRGLDGRKITAVSAPVILNATAGQYKSVSNGYVYTVNVKLINEGGKGGKLLLKLEDIPVNGKKQVFGKTINLIPSGIQNITWDIPVKNLCRRNAKICMENHDTSNWMHIAKMGDLRIMSAYPGRSYYTYEKSGKIVCSLIFSNAEIRSNGLKLKYKIINPAGKLLKEGKLKSTERKNIIEFLPGELKPGKYECEFILLNSQNQKVSAVKTEIIKRKPAPVTEVKFDHLSQNLLVNGKPQFILSYMAMFRNWDEKTLRKMRAAGFNMIVRWVNVYGGGQKSRLPIIRHDIKLAEKCGLWVIFPALTFVKRFNYRSLIQKMPQILKSIPFAIDSVKDCPAVIGYFCLDEPPESAYKYGFKVYDAVHQADPYRILYGTNCSDWGENSYEFADLLGRHSYWTPGRGFTPNKLARRCIVMRELAERYHRPFVATPQGCWREETRKITPHEMRISYYLPIICGAKGLVIFAYKADMHPVEWKAAAKIATELRKLAPILLTMTPPQNVVCNKSAASEGAAMLPGPAAEQTDFKPLIQSSTNVRLPRIQTLIKRHPDGGYIILAANSEDAPCEVTYALSLLNSNCKVVNFFNEKIKYEHSGNTFSDSLEGYAVRVYRIISGNAKNNDEKIRMSINIKDTASDKSKKISSENIIDKICGRFSKENLNEYWNIPEPRNVKIVSGNEPGKNILEMDLGEKMSLIRLKRTIPLKANTNYCFGANLKTDIKEALRKPDILIFVPGNRKIQPRKTLKPGFVSDWKIMEKRFTTKQAVKASIIIVLPKGKGKIYCDGIFIKEQGKPEKKKNYITNSSFEECTYFGLPDYWMVRPITANHGKKRALYKIVTDKSAVHGRYSLNIGWFSNKTAHDRFHNAVQYGKLDFSKNYVLSVYLKADRDNVPVTIFFKAGFRYAKTLLKKQFIVGSKWQRYVCSLPMKKMKQTGKRDFALAIRVDKTAEVLADCFQLEEGTIPKEYKVDDYKAVDVGPEYSREKVLDK